MVGALQDLFDRMLQASAEPVMHAGQNRNTWCASSVSALNFEAFGGTSHAPRRRLRHGRQLLCLQTPHQLVVQL